MNAKTPANVTPIAKKSADKQQPVEPTEPTTDQAMEKPKPKSKLSWKERLALMTPEEAAATRAKANEASNISKAKARGTTPVIAAAMRLKAQLARNIQRTALLEADRAKIEQELQVIEAQLVADQAGTEDGDATAQA